MKHSNQNEDLTPYTFEISTVKKLEKLKRIGRRIFYPPYTFINNIFLKLMFREVRNLEIDKLFLGHRGSDYETLRRKVNSFSSIKGKDILVIGCGTGRDLDSWLTYKPRKLVAIDLFRYDTAWNMMKLRYKELYPGVDIQFDQQDLNELNIKEQFDFVVSDAVFEHLRNFEKSLENVVKLLKQNGILYATFGPLWYSWGGDHIGGKLENGYNHLLLDEEDYKNSLTIKGDFQHDEGDGRTWIFNDLFSYLRPSEYLETLNSANLKKEYVSGMIEKRALKFEKMYPEYFSQLRKSSDYMSLIITGMTIIFRKK